MIGVKPARIQLKRSDAIRTRIAVKRDIMDRKNKRYITARIVQIFRRQPTMPVSSTDNIFRDCAG